MLQQCPALPFFIMLSPRIGNPADRPAGKRCRFFVRNRQEDRPFDAKSPGFNAGFPAGARLHILHGVFKQKQRDGSTGFEQATVF